MSADVKKFAKTYDCIKDDVLAHLFDYILASLKAGWEGVLFYDILDTPEGKQPMIAKRVLNVMTIKSVAYQYKYKLKLDMDKVRDFLFSIKN